MSNSQGQSRLNLFNYFGLGLNDLLFILQVSGLRDRFGLGLFGHFLHNRDEVSIVGEANIDDVTDTQLSILHTSDSLKLSVEMNFEISQLRCAARLIRIIRQRQLLQRDRRTMLVDDAVLVGIELDLGSIPAEIGEVCDRIDGNDGMLFAVPVQIKAAPRLHSVRIQVTFVPLVPELEDVEDLGIHVRSLIKDQVDVEVVLIRNFVEVRVPACDVDILQSDNAVEHFVVVLERAVEWLK